MILALQFSILT